MILVKSVLSSSVSCTKKIIHSNAPIRSGTLQEDKEFREEVMVFS
jgi:hypothetical protein